MQEENPRLFIAINVPLTVRQELGRLQASLRDADENLRDLISWARLDGLHLTLQFLGEITETRSKVVARILDEVVPEHPAFSMDLAGLGAFPVPSRARVLWVGVRSGVERVNRLQRELEERLRQVGFPREDRAFEAHLTLARLKDARRLTRLVASNSDYTIPSVPVRSVCLMRSDRDRGGSIYSELHSVNLRT
jgi:2'-5' RNA ligase